MKKSAKNHILLLAIPIILVATMIAACLIYGRSAATNAEARAIADANNDVSEHIATLSAAIEGRFNTLEACADMLSAEDSLDLSGEHVADKLAALRESTFFVDVFVVDRDGVGYTPERTTFLAVGRGYYLHAMSGLRSFERLDYGYVSNQPRFVFCVPIVRSGYVLGAILGTAKEESIRSLLFTESDSNCSIVCDGSGKIIIEAHNPTEKETDVVVSGNMLSAFEYDTSLKEQVAHDIFISKSGSVAFQHGGETRYAVYQRCGINGWMLFNILPSTVITDAVAETTRLTYAITFVIISISVLMLVYLAISFGRSEKKLTLDAEILARRTSELNFLVRSIPGGVFQYSAEADEQFVFISDNMLKLLGYTHEEFVEKFDNRFSQMIYHEDRERTLAEINEQIKDSDFDFCEYRIERADGSLIWVHDDGHIVTDEFGKRWYYVVIVDISEQKSIEEALREKNEENNIVIAQSGKSVIRYDINAARARHFGSISEVLGIPEVMDDYPESLLALPIVGEASREVFTKMYEQIKSGTISGSCSVQIQTLCSGMRWFHIDYTTILDDRERPSHAILSFFDNTDALEGEMAYEKLKSDLAATVAESVVYYEVNLSKDIVERAEVKKLSSELMPVGRSFYDFLRRENDEYLHPADRSEFFEFLDRNRLFSIYTAGVYEDAIELRVRISGEYRYCRLSVQLVKYPYSDELKAYVVLINVDSAHRERASLEELAYRDALTGLYNRATLERKIDAAISTMQPDDNAAMFMIDLDNFKRVNDTLGHQAGDTALTRQASVIAEVFGDAAFVGRLGGDEYMAYMPKNAERAVVEQKAGELVSGMQLSLGSVFVSASVGAALMEGPVKTQEMLYAIADNALYRAKQSGKSRYCIASEEAAAAASSEADVVGSAESFAAVQFKTLVENIDAGIITCEVGEQIKISYVSPSFFTSMQRTKEQIGEHGEKLMSLVYPEDAEHIRESLRETLSGKLTECTYRTVDAETHWRMLRAAKISETGNSVICVVTDITAIKRSEAQLKLAEERYRMASELSEALIWEVDIAERTLFLSEEAAKVIGLPRTIYENVPEGLIASGVFNVGTIDELKRLYSDLYSGIDGREYFLRSQNEAGVTVWVRSMFHLQHDAFGVPVRAIGVAEQQPNIDAEMVSFLNEQRFMHLVGANMLGTMFVNLSTDTFEEHSMSTPDYSDLSYSELVKRRERFVDPEDIPQYREITDPDYLIRCYRDGKSWLRLDYRRITKSGELRWTGSAYNLLRHPLSGSIYAAIYVYDIEQRHQMESSLSARIVRDTASTLYTRDTFAAIVSNAIAGLPEQSLCAMSVFGIDLTHSRSQLGTSAAQRSLSMIGRLSRFIISGNIAAGSIDETHIAVFQSDIKGPEALRSELMRCRERILTLLSEATDGDVIDIRCGFVVEQAGSAVYSKLLSGAQAMLEEAVNSESVCLGE